MVCLTDKGAWNACGELILVMVLTKPNAKASVTSELILRLEEGAVFSGNFILNYNSKTHAKSNGFVLCE